IPDHRRKVDGYYYWILRMNPRDAAARDIADGDLVKIYNERGAVICAAKLTERIRPGTVHSWESSAVYDPLGEPGQSADRGGCVNNPPPKQPQTKTSPAKGTSACLAEVEKWDGSIGIEPSAVAKLKKPELVEVT